jgi:hypothetical protein
VGGLPRTERLTSGRMTIGSTVEVGNLCSQVLSKLLLGTTLSLSLLKHNTRATDTDGKAQRGARYGSASALESRAATVGLRRQ